MVARREVNFALGEVVATWNAFNSIPYLEMWRGLMRHASGDWGELDEHDRNENEQALLRGGRLFSEYRTTTDIKFWIITEHDRSVTTVLLPEDY